MMNRLLTWLSGGGNEWENYAPVTPEWVAMVTGHDYVGRRKVSPEVALSFAAVWRAINLIGGQTASLPLHVYQKVSDDERKRQSGHPVERLFNDQANEEMDSLTFVELFVSWAPLWGNGYAWIERRGDEPVGLWPMFPWKMKPDRAEANNRRSQLVYKYTEDNGGEKTYQPRDILHLKNLTKDGIVGRSIITHARDSVGLGLDQQRFMANFYQNNATPAGALISKARMTRKAQKELRKQWEGMHGTPDNAGKVAVLHGDMDFKAFGMSMLDAQFLENRKLNVLEIARMFGVPPHLLFDLDRATFSNIEAQGIEWLTYGLRYWLTKVARLANRLLTDEEKAAGYYCEHETAALLTTDIKTRYEAYGLGLEKGFLNVNDVHRKENLPPIGPAGDVYRVQSNMVPADDMLESFDKRNPAKPSPVSPGPPRVQSGGRPAAVMFKRVWGKMIKREVWNVTDAAKKPGKFLERLEGFYSEHETVAAAELETPAALLAGESGEAVDCAAIVAAHCQESRNRLVDVSGRVTAAQLLAAVTEELETWQERQPEAVLCLKN
jgi:HK97 family phage portal protein